MMTYDQPWRRWARLTYDLADAGADLLFSDLTDMADIICEEIDQPEWSWIQMQDTALEVLDKYAVRTGHPYPGALPSFTTLCADTRKELS